MNWLDDLALGATQSGPASPFDGLAIPASHTKSGTTWRGGKRGVYLTAEDYMVPLSTASGEAWDAGAWASTLLLQHTRTDLLGALSVVNHASVTENGTAELTTYVLDGLPDPFHEAVVRALNGDTTIATGQPRVLVARQVVLVAMRAVAQLAPVDEAALAATAGRTLLPPGSIDLLAAAVLLTHAVAVGLAGRARPNERRIAGVPASTAIEMVCSGALTRMDSFGTLLGRTWMLWNDYGNQVAPNRRRLPPIDMVEEALGMPLRVALALGFAYYAEAVQAPTTGLYQKLPRPPHLHKTNPAHVLRFLDLYSNTPDQMATASTTARQPWQNRPIERKPLLRLPNDEIVVLDEQFLFQQITSGLFHLVAAHEERNYGPAAGAHWRDRTYADMHEALVEDYLTALGPENGLILDEHDLECIYDARNQGGGRADITVMFERQAVAVDAVSGQIKEKTRQDADLGSLEEDLRRLVQGKARQLAGTMAKLTLDPQPPGGLPEPATDVFALVVVGGLFPTSPMTRQLILELVAADRRKSARLLAAPARGILVMDLRDLEHLLSYPPEDRKDLPGLLAAWQTDENLGEASFSDWLLVRYPRNDSQLHRYPPLQEAFDDITKRFDLLFPPNVLATAETGPTKPAG